MLIIPKEEQEKIHQDAKNGLESHFNELMEDLLNKHSKVEKFWILGKTKTEAVGGGKTIVKPFLEACMEKPPLVKESFVYEVDTKRGVKTLLWVMHPDGKLVFPTLGKSISVAN